MYIFVHSMWIQLTHVRTVHSRTPLRENHPFSAAGNSRTVFFLTGDKPAAIHHKNTTSNSSSGSGSGHLPSVPLQIFLVGLLPLTITSGGSDFVAVLSGAVAWWRAWGITWLGLCRWWRGEWWWRGGKDTTHPSCSSMR